MKKRLFAILAVAALVLGLGGCATSPKKTDGPVKGETKTVNVGVSIYKFEDAFMTLYRNEITNYFKTLETDTVKYNVTIQDGKNDQAEQTAQIDAFIASKVDVIIANLVQATSAATVIEKCKAADIPVVFINREPSEADMKLWPDMTTYVGADAKQSGRFQGEIIADLPNKGDINGDGTLSYIMIMGDPENVDAQYRTQFSIEQYIAKSGLKVEELDKQRGNWERPKGQELVANALTQHGNKIEVVFCNNDDMALGAVQAIEQAGRKIGTDIYLVGVDALAEAQTLVQNGGMTGTVLNDHIGQSHTAVDAAVKAVAKEKLEAYYWVDYVKVVKK